jgi:hypothetical protein
MFRTRWPEDGPMSLDRRPIDISTVSPYNNNVGTKNGGKKMALMNIRVIENNGNHNWEGQVERISHGIEHIQSMWWSDLGKLIIQVNESVHWIVDRDVENEIIFCTSVEFRDYLRDVTDDLKKQAIEDYGEAI